jgi:hypothetical protein
VDLKVEVPIDEADLSLSGVSRLGPTFEKVSGSHTYLTVLYNQLLTLQMTCKHLSAKDL